MKKFYDLIKKLKKRHQLILTCSELSIKTLEKGVKYVQS